MPSPIKKSIKPALLNQKNIASCSIEMHKNRRKQVSWALLFAIFLLSTLLFKQALHFQASASQIPLNPPPSPAINTPKLFPPAELISKKNSLKINLLNEDAEKDQPETLALPGLYVIHVKRGENFFKILERKNIAASAGYKILANPDARELLSLLRPNDLIQIEIDKNGKLVKLTYKPNPHQKLTVYPDENDSYLFDIKASAIIKRLESKAYRLRHSLFIDGYQEGVPPEVLQNLMRLYRETPLDRFRLEKNTEISILYEVWLYEKPDGSQEVIKAGSILAAEIRQAGKSYALYQFPDADNTPQYYDAEGLQLGSELFQIPTRYKRVSSPFNPRRFHPILKRIRPHLGVDLAAPTGTPVVAANDGVVDFANWRGGYGKTVIIDHGERYSTLYAHLHSYQVQAGEHVKRGQVIGQVGSTGLSTGPHLHYEIRVDDIHRNPMTFSGQPVYIPDEQRAAFVERLSFYLEHLQKPTALASQQGSP